MNSNYTKRDKIYFIGPSKFKTWEHWCLSFGGQRLGLMQCQLIFSMMQPYGWYLRFINLSLMVARLF